MKKLILLLLIPALFFSCKEESSNPSEKEPNNTLANATVIDIGDTYEGEISISGDEDFYQFSGAANQKYTFYLEWVSGDTFDPDGFYGYIDDSSDFVGWYMDDNFEGEDETGGINVGSYDDTFYIVIYDFDGTNTGKYTLRVKHDGAVSGDSQENTGIGPLEVMNIDEFILKGNK